MLADPPPQVWTHVAYVFDSSDDVTLYVNGANFGTIAGTSPANSPNPK